MGYQIREKVRDAYSAAAQRPAEQHPFPVGRAFAESVGYSPDVLKGIPDACIERFAGVSNVSVRADLPEGATFLDLGCGAGLDTIIAARRVGPNGRVIGIDFSDAMLTHARGAAAHAGIDNVVFCRADAERLPLADASVDGALVNGIFNLNPARGRIFRELARAVRKGGTVDSAELILSRPLPSEQQSDTNWFA